MPILSRIQSFRPKTISACLCYFHSQPGSLVLIIMTFCTTCTWLSIVKHVQIQIKYKMRIQLLTTKAFPSPSPLNAVCCRKSEMWAIIGTSIRSRRDVLNTHQMNERKTWGCLFYFSFLKDMKIQTLMASSNDQCLYIRIYVVCCVVVLWDEQIWLWRPSCGSHVACTNINTALRPTLLETHRDLWRLLSKLLASVLRQPCILIGTW